MQRYLPLLLVVGLVIGFRILGSLLPHSQPNFQPLVALFFCGALLAPGWRGFAIPLGIWAVTYSLGVGHTGNFAVFATTMVALAVTFLLGKSLATKGFPLLLVGSIAAAAVFHLITNGAAWLGSPLYAKTVGGLWQSLWTGPAGSEIPSWVFLRNLAAANLLFTGVFASARIQFPRFAHRRPSNSESVFAK